MNLFLIVLAVIVAAFIIAVSVIDQYRYHCSHQLELNQKMLYRWGMYDIHYIKHHVHIGVIGKLSK